MHGYLHVKLIYVSNRGAVLPEVQATVSETLCLCNRDVREDLTALGQLFDYLQQTQNRHCTYRVIQNDFQDFKNLSYTIHMI